MATTRRTKAQEQKTFTQTIFAKKYEGEEERGICVQARFYPLHSVSVGDVIHLREPMPGRPVGAPYELSFDGGQTWRPLPHFYRNI